MNLIWNNRVEDLYDDVYAEMAEELGFESCETEDINDPDAKLAIRMFKDQWEDWLGKEAKE